MSLDKLIDKIKRRAALAGTPWGTPYGEVANTVQIRSHQTLPFSPRVPCVMMKDAKHLTHGFKQSFANLPVVRL